MNFRAAITCGAITVWLCAAVTGCFPASQSQMEEEKESHYLDGKSCVNSMDYGGAVEAFEKAVEVNPRSASAHFQLGWLYEEKEKDPAAAIYHYRQYLKLRPNADNAEVVKQHVMNCKQDLAKDVLPLPVAPAVQRELEQMADANKKLRAENEQLKVENEGLKAALAGLRQQAMPNQPVTAPVQSGAPTNAGRVSNVPPRNQAQTGRTYIVHQGDTPAAIARRFGVKLEALLAANPGLEPRRMAVGKTLNIP